MGYDKQKPTLPADQVENVSDSSGAVEASNGIRGVIAEASGLSDSDPELLCSTWTGQELKMLLESIR
ncbi:hypothetical protein Nepgr_024632 [Nepenthes gracilis]|uniref:Uncharacterized protein n=1 Tax=Nepenthes gracilis TaxID=150966 RepID=A0AAD3T5J7_NEPGR|nr:hypothetical protein Nepgr_024632 [Nepenthes gracilis]